VSFLKRTRSFAARALKDEDGSERTLLGFSPRRRDGHAAADQVSVCLHSEVSSTPVDVHHAWSYAHSVPPSAKFYSCRTYRIVIIARRVVGPSLSLVLTLRPSATQPAATRCHCP